MVSSMGIRSVTFCQTTLSLQKKKYEDLEEESICRQIAFGFGEAIESAARAWQCVWDQTLTVLLMGQFLPHFKHVDVEEGRPERRP